MLAELWFLGGVGFAVSVYFLPVAVSHIDSDQLVMLGGKRYVTCTYLRGPTIKGIALVVTKLIMMDCERVS